MKLEALDHPKTMDLAARLNVELPTAIGHLELLWAFTGKKAPQGNIGKWPDGAIARACYWMGRPETFTQALQEAGFIDADPMHRFTVHDWREHAPRWVKSKLSSMGVGFIDQDASEDTSPDISPPSKGSEVKPREVKEVALARATPGLDLSTWDRWLEYRKAKRKPIGPESLIAAAKAMAGYGSDQAACVEQSISAGWQGLFALKDPKKFGAQSPVDRRQIAIARIAQHATEIGCPLVPRETEPAESFETRVKQWERDNVRGPPGEGKFLNVTALAAAKRVGQ